MAELVYSSESLPVHDRARLNHSVLLCSSLCLWCFVCDIQDVEEQCISSADTPSLRLPWMSYQLKARMAKPATARGGVLHIQFCLKRQHSRMKSMSVQADLLQRITLNFGGKSTTPITVPGQKLARSNGQPGGYVLTVTLVSGHKHYSSSGNACSDRISPCRCTFLGFVY